MHLQPSVALDCRLELHICFSLQSTLHQAAPPGAVLSRTPSPADASPARNCSPSSPLHILPTRLLLGSCFHNIRPLWRLALPRPFCIHPLRNRCCC